MAIPMVDFLVVSTVRNFFTEEVMKEHVIGGKFASGFSAWSRALVNSQSKRASEARRRWSGRHRSTTRSAREIEKHLL